jgi:histidinol-phosphate aminotransferase
MYGVCAQINDVEQKRVLLNSGFQLDADALIRSVDAHTKMIFLCSPNNPTANSMDRDAILRIINEVPCMVVLDEAYIDFSDQKSMAGLVSEMNNLVVLQTLSKAWGLAGIRLGMVFAHEILIETLAKVKYPYNINTLTMEAAMKSLSHAENRIRWIGQILDERALLKQKLRLLSFIQTIYPSDANFLLAKMDRPKEVYKFLMDRGIIVRDRSSVPLCEGCLRITIGTPEENKKLLLALEAYAATTENE